MHAAASGLKDLVACPACDFMVEMGDQIDTGSIVRCLDPACGKVSCRWCGQDDHRPVSCDEVEQDGEVKIRTFLEERVTAASVRRCPNKDCRKPYERTEGCNHIRCPCGTHSCYLCGLKINPVRPYDHYSDGRQGGGVNAKGSRCTVYGMPEWAKKEEARSHRATREDLQEYLREDPELQGLVEKTDFLKKRGLEALLEPEVKRSRLGFQRPCIIQ